MFQTRKFRWEKKYLYWGVTAFLVICAALLFYMFLNHLTGLRDALGRLGSILSPFIWGLVIAYLLYPLMKIYQKQLFYPLGKLLFKNKARREEKTEKFSRAMAVLLSVISLLIIITALIWLVGPQIYSSAERLINNSSSYLQTVNGWLDRLLSDYPELEAQLSVAIGSVSAGITGFISSLLPEITTLLGSVTSTVYAVAKSVYNVIVGIIVSVYVLYSKESFGAHCKKILYCIFSLEAAKRILDAVDFINRVFMGFISGKLLDSLIIGVLCYICCAILNIPYAMLVSFLVGITNIIPFFGPIFGIVPSAFIILMVQPVKALVFVICGLLLQQLDGNVIGPKILGSSVGINGFWIMFAIILGAGLFGFSGMVLGVPVFVVIYAFFSGLIARKLKRSGLSANTEDYMDMAYYDPETGEPVRHSERPRKKSIRKKPVFPFGQKTKEETKDSVPPDETDITLVSDDEDAQTHV